MTAAIIILSLVCVGLLLALLYAICIARENADAAVQARREVKSWKTRAECAEEKYHELGRKHHALEQQMKIKQRILDGVTETERRRAECRSDETRGNGAGSHGIK